MSDNHMSLVDFFDLHQKLATDSLILDVRRPDEFSEGHIQGAMNIPLDELTTRYLELKSFAKIYIHCKRGGRAKTAFDILKQLGMTNIICIHDAGMDQWIQNGYPVKR
jgi:rhodanese-related sulfurtransferase